MKILDLDILSDLRKTGLQKLFPGKPRLTVGMGTCGIGNGADKVLAALTAEAEAAGLDAVIVPVGCFGCCAFEPVVGMHLPGQPLVLLEKVAVTDAPAIIAALKRNTYVQEKALCRIEEWDHITAQVAFGRGCTDIPHWDEIPYFKGQKKIVLRNCGLINPEDVEEYIAVGGYHALFQAMHAPNKLDIIEEVKRAKLRGRGGAGYPTGVKWGLLEKAEADVKYVICNADEGDPGAYMNRNEIESDPHALIEGMLIGAYATGASEGIVYLRAEYPLAVERLQKAVAEARACGIIGEHVFGTGFHFNLMLVEGAGAFVCGEETAMIASLEGRAGRPRPRPPFPAQQGLWGKPTNINNVETWINIPAILARGASWYAGIGTANSTGTKVFSLVGKIRNTGLVEMPLGSPLKKIVYEIGQGAGNGKKIKAVQTGGPSGGCIPVSLFDTPVDYESLAAIGAIMGSGGMVVMDEDNCMVDVARYFVEFTHSESCGKCIPCRDGLDQALRMLNRITSGEATAQDVADLEELSHMIKECSLCGLGQTAPNPVLTTLRHFRHEYDEHIRAKRCSSGVCEKLYLSPCENSCPLHMRIPGFLQLLQEGRLEDAAEMIWLDNPLPASTGRICQHPCENRCRRGSVDGPLNMREVHRYIADITLHGEVLAEVTQRLQAGRLPATGKKVAVVGAGPSGLAAAFYLAMFGHEVTVYDSREEPGGMLRYALPEYRLPKAELAREIGVLPQLGIQFVFSKTLGTNLSLDSLESENSAVFLAIGTWKENAAGIAGEDGPGVWHAIGFLEQVVRAKAPAMGRRVVVIGGGNAAVDSARTCIRLGCEVTIAYRRERADMPAIVEEVVDAEREGVSVRFLVTPQRIIRDGQGRVNGLELLKTRLGDYDASGRRTPISTGETVVVPCDSVIMAVGEKPDIEPLRRSALQVRGGGTALVDGITYETNRPNVHAGGDLVTGASNVSSTMATGKAAARAIDRKLTGEDRMAIILKKFNYRNEVEVEPRGGGRNDSVHLTAEQRKDRFDEVMQGFTPEEAMAESVRCLRCDVKEVCPAVQGGM